MLSILQSQFAEKCFKKANNSEQNVVLLLFLFTLTNLLSWQTFSRQTFCRGKSTFVATKDALLSQQKICYNKNDMMGAVYLAAED